MVLAHCTRSGRWNTKGATRLSYTALTPDTALAEAFAHVNYYSLPPNKALPRVLVALKFKGVRILDLRDGKVRKSLVLSKHTIHRLDWRAENQNGREAITQAWGQAFANAGIEGSHRSERCRPSWRQRPGISTESAARKSGS